MIQHRDPGSCSSMSLSKATHSRLSSDDSSRHCPLSTRDQSEWLQYKILHVSPLKSVVFFSPWQAKTLLPFRAGCYLGFCSCLWRSELQSPVWGLGFTPLRGNLPLLRCPSLNLVCSHGSGPAPLMSPSFLQVSRWPPLPIRD